MAWIEERAQVPVEGRFDVIVAGGGVAGVAAALAARRLGKQVLLLEKSLTLGGLATLGLINLFVPMCNGRGRQIIKGMCEEFVRLSMRYGYDTIPPAWREGEPGEAAKERYATRFSPNLFALTLTEAVLAEGVTLLLDCLATRPVMQGGHIDGLLVETKSGRGYYEAGMVIDTTGDADILHRAGVPVVDGRNFFTYVAMGLSLESCRRAVDAGRIDRAVYAVHGGPATLYGKNQPEGRRLYKGTTASDVTEYVVENQMQMLNALRGEDRFARDIVTLPGMAQFRTTRRLDGDYTLTVEDCYRHFDDSIGAICDFDNRDFLYEVPYRCLMRKGFDNVLTAGRSASAAGYAWDVLRVIPPAIITGQAAGSAAALALDAGVPVEAIDRAALQAHLAASDVMIHFDDAWIPEKTGEAETPAEDIGHI